MPTPMSTRMGKPLSTDFDRVLRSSRPRFSHGCEPKSGITYGSSPPSPAASHEVDG